MMRLLRLSLPLALLLFSLIGVYAQTEDAPRLTEAKVIEIAEAKISPEDLALYRPGPALYVHASRVWELTYKPKKKKDASGNRIPPIKFYVDDTTGLVTKHLLWLP